MATLARAAGTPIVTRIAYPSLHLLYISNIMLDKYNFFDPAASRITSPPLQVPEFF